MATIVLETTQTITATSPKPYVDISESDWVAVQINGGFTGLSFQFQVSLDGTNWGTFAMHQVSNSNVVNDITGGSGTLLATKPCQGYKYFRTNVTAISSGEAIVKIVGTALEK